MMWSGFQRLRGFWGERRAGVRLLESRLKILLGTETVQVYKQRTLARTKSASEFVLLRSSRPLSMTGGTLPTRLVQEHAEIYCQETMSLDQIFFTRFFVTLADVNHAHDVQFLLSFPDHLVASSICCEKCAPKCYCCYCCSAQLRRYKQQHNGSDEVITRLESHR